MKYRRRELILKYTVELFVKTAQPVGSNSLIEEYNLNFSSATIRAEMNALEQAGYLEKPHTSSGRVPSSLGYEYYVNHLREKIVSDNIKQSIQLVIDNRTKSIEQVINESCEILAQMTNLVSVILGPKGSNERLQSIQVMPFARNSATAIFMTDQGYVEHKTFMIPPESSLEEVIKVVGVFNDRLIGSKISEVTAKMELLKPMLKDHLIEQEVIANAFTEAFVRYAKDRLALYGKESLLEQPEFINDSEKLRRLISILDDPEKIRELITGEGDLTISIGGKDSDLSLISSKISLPGHNQGQLVLMGPKRMDYNSVLWAVEYVTDALEKYFDIERELNDE